MSEQSLATPVILPRPTLHTASFWRELLDTLVLIAMIYTLVNLASGRYVVEGASMQPNFATGQVLIVSRVHYLLSDPQRGDIVVFHPPGYPLTESPYIKRVIGTPGDTVEIRDREVYVNGVQLDEPYINEPCGSSCRDNIWVLGADQYFVMGDNRNHSSDSRAFRTPVTREAIIGKAFIRYWPPQDWGIVEHIAFPE
ncbi:MAG: signal peptidase I [Anaerolineaceae bacterium]|nr:signal peptidase I [Anaerolineaceae bacterium]